MENNYNLTGVLEFLKSAFQGFERERWRWMKERQELQARAAQLESERRSQESVERDLLLRVKMLEFALRQERAQYAQASSSSLGGEATRPGPPSVSVPDTNTVLRKPTSLPSLSPSQLNSTPNQPPPLSSSRPPDNLVPLNRPQHDISSISGGGPGTDHSDLQMLFALSAASGLTHEDDQNQSHQFSSSSSSRMPTIFSPPPDQASDVAAIAANLARSAVSSSSTVIRTRLPSPTAFATPLQGIFSSPSSSPPPPPSQETTSQSQDFASTARYTPSTSPPVKSPSSAHPLAPVKSPSSMPTDGFTAVVPPPPAPPPLLVPGNDGETTLPLDSPLLSRNPDNAPPPVPRAFREMEELAEDLPQTESSQGRTAHANANANASGTSASVEANEDEWQMRAPKYTLRSHLDCVRCVDFHPVEPVLVSASDDGTCKLWKLPGAGAGGPSGRKSNLTTVQDMEPIVTLRGHSGPVLTAVISTSKNRIFTAGVDSTIRSYLLPPLATTEAYASYGSSIAYKGECFVGHTQAVWGVVDVYDDLLLSFAADGHIRLWATSKPSPLLQSFCYSSSPPSSSSSFSASDHLSDSSSLFSSRKLLVPTSVDLVRTDVRKVIAAYESSAAVIFDLETAAAVVQWDARTPTSTSPPPPPPSHHLSGPNTPSLASTTSPPSPRSSTGGADWTTLPPDPHTQINKIITHSTLPLAITAHENKRIQFFDLNSGKCVHSMVAHQDAVSCLDLDPSGLYLVSGGHDSSLRFWDLRKKGCVHEMTAHRPKYHEAVLSVRYHPSRNLLASSGADSIIKVF